MNNKKRDMLREILRRLKDCRDRVEHILADEHEAMENYPENLQGDDRFGQMELAADNLDAAAEKLGEAIELITEAME